MTFYCTIYLPGRGKKSIGAGDGAARVDGDGFSNSIVRSKCVALGGREAEFANGFTRRESGGKVAKIGGVASAVGAGTCVGISLEAHMKAAVLR